MYIKREDMHLVIEKDRNYGWFASDGTVVFSKSEVHEMLNTIPSADVAEVKRGEWLVDVYAKDTRTGYEYLVFKCSECGCGCASRNNFCHNCGADMRKDGE